MPQEPMTSSRPYLIRAIYQWVIDNDHTPYMLVDAEREGVEVPADYVENGRIVLNLAPTAIRGLSLGNEIVEFKARFGGELRPISVPAHAVLALYSRETGQGMMFTDDEGPTSPPSGPSEGDGSDTKGRSHLKVVK
jgi:stringent starvation protein B